MILERSDCKCVDEDTLFQFSWKLINESLQLPGSSNMRRPVDKLIVKTKDTGERAEEQGAGDRNHADH